MHNYLHRHFMTFIQAALLSATLAHFLHFRTADADAHRALDPFYGSDEDNIGGSIVGLVDRLAECYMGEVGIRLSLCEPAATTVFAFLSNLSNRGAVDLIAGIKGMAEDLMKANDSYDGAASLSNILQEIVALCQQTIYRLTLIN